MMESAQWDPNLWKLAEEFEESDTELEECDTENEIGELTAEIEALTAELEKRDQKISKLTADLGESDAKIKERDRKVTKLAAEIRRLTALLGDRDLQLRKLTAELAKCDATIRLFTVELGERHTKIGELAADVEDRTRKLRHHQEQLEAREEQIREKEAEIRRLKELLEEREEELGQLRTQLDEALPILPPAGVELLWEPRESAAQEAGSQDATIAELSAEIEERDRRIEDLAAELDLCRAQIRLCLEQHRQEEEKMAEVTLDPDTAHRCLLLSSDGLSVRWEFPLQGPPPGPQRFVADPCVLGLQGFTSGRHCWIVDLTGGQYCAVGVSKESLPREGPLSFSPEEGIWALQQWGFRNRALTSPPTPLELPRVPRRVRVSLDYEWGRVAFFDVDNQSPIFTFPPASFAGERIRPWFWLELGSLTLVR